MNASIIKTQIIHEMKYDPEVIVGHLRSTFCLKIHFFLEIFFV